MASSLNPYISFTDNAREAMEFYQSVFGGTLRVSTFGEFGQSGPDADKLMHAALETDDGFTLMGADTPTGMDHDAGTNISVSLSGDDAGRLRGWWDKLSQEGTVDMPLEKQMWGDEFGMCTDPYGTRWMVNVTSGPGAVPGA